MDLWELPASDKRSYNPHFKKANFRSWSFDKCNCRVSRIRILYVRFLTETKIEFIFLSTSPFNFIFIENVYRTACTFQN